MGRARAQRQLQTALATQDSFPCKCEKELLTSFMPTCLYQALPLGIRLQDEWAKVRRLEQVRETVRSSATLTCL